MSEYGFMMIELCNWSLTVVIWGNILGSVR
nr:MAG TPA: hypothetical protein [Caudoviricetes sp.]